MSFLNRTPKSYIVTLFNHFIEWGNRHLTLSSWLFKTDENIFKKIEIMVMSMTIMMAFLLAYIDHVPEAWFMVVGLLMLQRVVEYIIVYSRVFILNRGRIFTHFHDDVDRGEWLIMLFFFSVTQVALAFATIYRMLIIVNDNAFSRVMTAFDSFYFSVTTFLAIGYGDIAPMTSTAKAFVVLQGLIFFYTIVIVINGLITVHFIKR